jgi:hypothetical protein
VAAPWDSRSTSRWHGRATAVIVAVAAVLTLAACGSSGHRESSAATKPPATRTPATRTPATGTPVTGTPATGTPAGTAPVTATPTVPPGTAPVTSPAHTTVETFSPWTAAGRISAGTKVLAHVRGACFAASIAVPLSSAYRCKVGNQIYDPCLVAPGDKSSSLACAASPWSGVQVLHLTRPLPLTSTPLTPASATVAEATARPWALALANGTRCVVDTGTTPQLGAVSLPFGCGPQGALASQVDESRQPWTVQLDEHASAGGLAPMDVRTAWD